MDPEKAETLAERELRRHGLTAWTFGFDRAVRRTGVCFYRRRHIGLSRPFVAANDERIVLDTIRHELAHALAWYLYTPCLRLARFALD